MSVPTVEQVTRMLAQISEGDGSAADKLLPIVYDELRGLADHFLRGERADHTLQATALVHEVYLKLVDQRDARWQDKMHFYRVAAQAMRRILVNHARDHQRLKRGGGQRRVALDAVDDPAAGSATESVDLVALDESMERLAAIDERKVQVVQLRYFGGLSVEETAEALGISPAQVKRDWTMARTWLLRDLQRGS